MAVYLLVRDAHERSKVTLLHSLFVLEPSLNSFQTRKNELRAPKTSFSGASRRRSSTRALHMY